MYLRPVGLKQIWVNPVSNLSAARCAAVYADVLIFELRKNNPHYISPIKASEIIPWINGPEIWGFFEGENPETRMGQINLLSLDGFILSMADWESSPIKNRYFLELFEDNLLAISGRIKAMAGKAPCYIKGNWNPSCPSLMMLLSDGQNPVFEWQGIKPSDLSSLHQLDLDYSLAFSAPDEHKTGMADLSLLQDILEAADDLRS